MIKFFVLLALMFSLPITAHAASDDCLYDQANQLEKLQTIAATKPHARVNADEREVSWVGRDRTRWLLVYGGCSHLGFAITASKKQKPASKESVVFQMANRIASEF